MNAEVFVDTNVLLCTLDEDPASTAKRRRAQQLLLTERWGWSVQVAAEFFVNATSVKRPFRMATTDAAALVESWMAYPNVDLTPAVFRAAVDLHQRFQLSYWGAAILAAAARMGCHTVFSEDFTDGQSYDGITVVDPFAGLGH